MRPTKVDQLVTRVCCLEPWADPENFVGGAGVPDNVFFFFFFFFVFFCQLISQRDIRTSSEKQGGSVLEVLRKHIAPCAIPVGKGQEHMPPPPLSRSAHENHCKINKTLNQP